MAMASSSQTVNVYRRVSYQIISIKLFHDLTVMSLAVAVSFSCFQVKKTGKDWMGLEWALSVYDL